jgi:hypothetical protein
VNITQVSVNINECGRGTVRVNGADVSCRDITIRAGVERMTEVTMTLYANVDGVVIPAPRAECFDGCEV